MDRVGIGERIQKLRKLQNITREELAEKSEISSKFLYEVELGKKGISAATLLKIANNLSCSCDYILLGEKGDKRGMDKAGIILEKFEPEQKEKIVSMLEMMLEVQKKKE